MKCFVTGAAGFIGSNLVDRLLQDGHTVVGVDNFSTGLAEFLNAARQNKLFTLFEGNLLDRDFLNGAMHDCDIVFHLAANADVRFGADHPEKDLQQNTIATSHVLMAMQKNRIQKIIFASTGSIYGDAEIIPTPENSPFPIQTSFYGASKLAAESLIQAYCEGFGFQTWIFRFVSILGERYTHGHVFDFYKQLLAHPDQLNVLGDGKQKKSYLYVQDCINAILFSLNFSKEKINIFNLGTDEYCEVNNSIQWISDYLKITPKVVYSGGKKGWIGDNPFIFLDCKKIHDLGWNPKLSIKEGVIQTLQFLERNKWLLNEK
ncbi:MAG: nucleoside-diphosphate sugar epimerase [Gammaproteobacteria bacterium RIFCSPHIGHO2_12_FULL_40_19]|nr:MAG: nucleoside-diphosphate sugar epimerase [Gammaproteobacteria bacterium RIFCSPHIGHO2_12_FULL_40_19]